MHALLRDSWANLLPPQISPLFTACVTQKFHLTKTLGYIAFCPLCNEIMGAETPAELHGHEVRCNGCGELVCIDCGCKWHAGQTCAQYKGSQVDGATQALLNECKRCPNCNEGIVHYRGHACHHIKPGGGCPSCGHHFCYVCLGPHNECGCPWQGSSFCRRPVGRDPSGRPDCGCPICPDCRPGHPCPHCDGNNNCLACFPLTETELAENQRLGLGPF